MNELLNYINTTIKTLDKGEMDQHPDPALPADLGSALTQSEIDTLKKFVKEITERYNPPAPPPLP